MNSLSANEDISKIKKFFSLLKESYDDIYLGPAEIQSLIPETIEKYKEDIIENSYSLNGLFAGCSSLKNLPDISKWNIKKTKGISCLFQG